MAAERKWYRCKGCSQIFTYGGDHTETDRGSGVTREAFRAAVTGGQG